MVIDPPSGPAWVRATILAAVEPGIERRRALRGEAAQELGIGLVDQPVAGVEQACRRAWRNKRSRRARDSRRNRRGSSGRGAGRR